jgi:hypothetical protein
MKFSINNLSEMKNFLALNPSFKLKSGRTISAVELAMVRLYQLQTKEEQDNSITTESNGVGFNAFDAKIGTSFAKTIMAGYKLFPNKLIIAKKLALKYSKQLLQLKINKDKKRNEYIT